MKKILSIIAALAALLLTSGCTEEMEGDFVHDDATISAIYLLPGTGTTSISIAGTIDNEAETIKFIIPKTKRKDVDISQVKLRANVALDAKITPSLFGWQDLSEPLEITVTATMTGTKQKYTISASYEK